MTGGQFIKKTTSVTLYFIVLYYLLPFRPVYLYYSAHHSSADILQEIKKEKGNQTGKNLASDKEFRHNNDIFPKKDQVRFFISGFIIPSPHSNECVFFTKKKTHPFLQSDYQSPLVLFNFNRGPPLV